MTGTPTLSRASSDWGRRASSSISPPGGDAEQGARAGADHLAGLDAAAEHEAGGRRADVEPADLGAGRAELGLGDADAGRGGVAGGALLVEIGLADEAAADQRLGAVELVLGELQVGARHFDLGGELGRLLRLDRAIDHRQRLAGADPLAGLDEHALDLAAFAGDADRHVAARGERAGRGDEREDILAAGDDEGDGGQLLALILPWAPRPSRRARPS